MIYKIDNHADNVLDMDNATIFAFIKNKYELQEASYDEILEMMKDITRDQKKLHELAVETDVPIYDILRVIVSEVPELVDRRFLTRMRKKFNTIHNSAKR